MWPSRDTSIVIGQQTDLVSVQSDELANGDHHGHPRSEAVATCASRWKSSSSSTELKYHWLRGWRRVAGGVLRATGGDQKPPSDGSGGPCATTIGFTAGLADATCTFGFNVRRAINICWAAGWQEAYTPLARNTSREKKAKARLQPASPPLNNSGWVINAENTSANCSLLFLREYEVGWQLPTNLT